MYIIYIYQVDEMYSEGRGALLLFLSHHEVPGTSHTAKRRYYRSLAVPDWAIFEVDVPFNLY